MSQPFQRQGIKMVTFNATFAVRMSKFQISRKISFLFFDFKKASISESSEYVLLDPSHHGKCNILFLHRKRRKNLKLSSIWAFQQRLYFVIKKEEK